MIMGSNIAKSHTVNIRLARPEELSRLREIEDEAAQLFSGFNVLDESRDESFSERILANLIAMRQVWVCSVGDSGPIGMVIVSVWGRVVYIEEMDVVPAYGRQGIGTRLLSHVCFWAASDGHERMLLSTFADIPWNGPFYRKNGFSFVSESEWSERMQLIRDEETRRGLDVSARAFMEKYLLPESTRRLVRE